MVEATLNLDDVQGLVVRGYGRLLGAAFLVLRFDDPAAGRRWLEHVVPHVTSAVRPPLDTAVNVAFTFPGLIALGVDRDTIAGFAPAFVDGMVGPHRSRILGDVGASAPEAWAWGGPSTEAVHAVLLLYASDDERIAVEIDRHRTALRTAGVTLVTVLETHLNVDRFGVKEHFGFRDGIGQPAIAGAHTGVRAENTVATGEFLLGYLNEYGQYPSTAVVPDDPTGLLPRLEHGRRHYDLGRNGTYLVLRQLEQDVKKFWTTLRARTTTDDAMVWLGSKMIGRWPSGAPLVTTPKRDLPGIETFDAFDYAGDPDGLACPLGAHARRANPRDALPNTKLGAQSLRVTKRHRIIRRGRHYGRPLDPSMDPVRMLHAPPDDEPRGLHFLAFNANIERQFEFIQHTWLNDPKFGALYAGPDPLFGDRLGNFHDFVVPDTPVRRRHTGLEPFVTVRGGAYFFMPGLLALRYLAKVDHP